MRITFLGTSAGVPTRQRNVAGVALQLPQRGEWWLFDCGEGTQHQILRASALSLGQLTRVFITHMHGDHLFGLPGLLATGRLAGGAHRAHVYGPVGISEYLHACWRSTAAEAEFPVEIHELKPGEIYRDEDFTVGCLPLKHRVPAYGFRVTEHDRPGRFRAEEAAALGVPFGPLFGQLKRGEMITLPDGQSVDGTALCDPAEPGRAVAYSGDTIYSEAMIELARDVDVLIHEATFSERDEGLARRSRHSTTTMAARVAAESGARTLMLTHISPRYAPGTATTTDDLLREARAIFPQTELAHDFLTFEVPRRINRPHTPEE
ncbi:MAG: ribonuclease Z [Acidobacteriota bacterium]|nr:ribonuclease Z [Acidobacteriota bacterium]